jgi:hypothetical protein
MVTHLHTIVKIVGLHVFPCCYRVDIWAVSIDGSVQTCYRDMDLFLVLVQLPLIFAGRRENSYNPT